MESQTKACQNCKQQFVIEPDDFSFYEKMAVPPPTFCAECRFQRRLSFANERYLYKNNCGLCGKDMIAMYPPKTPFPVYCLDCYRGDKWDPFSFGKPYDFNRPFFEQFQELKLLIPRAQIVQQGETLGSEYCNRASHNKNCYLIIRANYNEDCRYSFGLTESQDCVDCFDVDKSQLAYQGIELLGCYRVQYCQECRQCRDSYFLFDCRNCSNCIGCTGLRNKKYHILNKPYTKEEYEKQLKDLRLDTVLGLAAFAPRFQKLVDISIRESLVATNCVKSTGNWLTDCKETKNSYQCRGVEDGKNLLFVFDAKDCMDYSYWGRNSELIYETSNCGYDCSRIRFVNECWNSCHDLTYCDNCYSSSNLFGCVGLKSNEYCILNTQYSKEDYQKMVPKIIAHMNEMPYTDKKGRIYKFGEFFPAEFSASAYNTTAAHDYFPLTKQETLAQEYAWEDRQEKDYKPTKSWKDLPEDIASVTDDITKEIILCKAWDIDGDRATEEHNCTKAFRITPGELGFYRRMNIPLPRECLNTRHFERFKKRNPLRLWKRTCKCAGNASESGGYKNTSAHFHKAEHCPNTFETSYANNRPEIVYCEQCYQAEIS